MGEFKSIIPAWCAEQAAHIVKNYGSDPAFLEGAIAAALHSERERAAKLCDQRAQRHKEQRHIFEAEEDQDDCLKDALEAMSCAKAIRKDDPPKPKNDNFGQVAHHGTVKS